MKLRRKSTSGLVEVVLRGGMLTACGEEGVIMLYVKECVLETRSMREYRVSMLSSRRGSYPPTERRQHLKDSSSQNAHLLGPVVEWKILDRSFAA